MRGHLRRWRSILIALAIAIALGSAYWRTRIAAPSGPPAQIVEGFLATLADHRYEEALAYLSDHLRAQTIGETLAVRVNMLERRTGRLSNVRGVPQWTKETRAYATAAADTEKNGPLTLGFGLVREERGMWRIDELYDLGWKPAGLQ